MQSHSPATANYNHNNKTMVKLVTVCVSQSIRQDFGYSFSISL